MSDMISTSFQFPTVLFSFALIVVILYWATVLIGAMDIDVLDATGDDGAGSGGLTGLLPVVRIARGTPVTVVVSLWILFSWFGCLVGAEFTDEVAFFDELGDWLSVAVLLVAPVVAWVVTLIVVAPLSRVYGQEVTASRHDFVGATCVIRTGSVGPDFGQAEVTSSDGSTAVIQVRQFPDRTGGMASLGSGSVALIFDYDADGEYFLVTPFDLPLGDGSVTI